MIRYAMEKDIEKIEDLLSQVDMVHHNGRPDIFKIGNKYSEEELKELLNNKQRPILVSVNETDEVVGYCFGIFQQHKDNSILTDIKTLYIDDLCVDEELRGQHIGKQLYEYVLAYARKEECYNVTLNVWTCNEGAMKFYEKCGLVPQKVGMEILIEK